MLSTTANESAVLSGWDVDCKNDTIAKGSDGFLEFGFEFVDQFGFSAKFNLIRRFTLTGAGY